MFRANIIDNWTFPELLDAFALSYKTGSKTAVFYVGNIYDFVIKEHLNRTDPPKLLKERFMLEAKVFWFHPQHYLFKIFDRKLQQYVEANLVEYNVARWNEENDPKKFQKEEEPFAILTLGDLDAGFVVWMVPFVLSIFVFMLEWMPTLKDLLVFMMIFKKYYNIKEKEQSKRNILIENFLLSKSK